MALFSRRKPNGRRAEEEAEFAEIRRVPKTIGELLAEAREQHGLTIEAVGATLRIRAAFLRAIEENRYDRLPGPVYALGFVRSYADHLGLDGESFARRFKNEVAGLETKQDFSLPMPLPERGMPGGALLLIALILAACAYAVWYYRGTGERARPERVAAVPQQLMPPPAPPRPAPTLEAAVPVDTTSASASTAVPPPSPPVPPPPVTAAAPGPAAPATPGPTAAAAASPVTSPRSPPATELPAAPAVAPVASPPGSAPAQVAVAPPPPPPIPDVPQIPAVPATAAAAEAPRVYGITNGPVRVVIKAAADSWVQVKDSNQSVLQMRVLKQGESLRVPDRPGLTLRTGNAGALEITVDGKPVPAVGPVGKTRNVSLDPQRLAAGTAPLE